MDITAVLTGGYQVILAVQIQMQQQPIDFNIKM